MSANNEFKLMAFEKSIRKSTKILWCPWLVSTSPRKSTIACYFCLKLEWFIWFFDNYKAWIGPLRLLDRFCFHRAAHDNTSASMDNGCLMRKSTSPHCQKSTPNPKFLGMAKAYFVCSISPKLQMSLIYAFIGCP